MVIKMDKQNEEEKINKVPEGKKEIPSQQVPQMRQIVILTDGNNIKISRNETSGSLELLAVLQALIGSLTSQK